mgnify:CR=1 FL=1
MPSNFPHYALRGAARLSFTARIEGAHSDRAASASKKDSLAAPLSLQARSFPLPTAAPERDTERAAWVNPELPLPPHSRDELPLYYSEGGRADPQLRASNEGLPRPRVAARA